MESLRDCFILAESPTLNAYSSGGREFVWMDLYELRQPVQSKEPTHFITAPAHQALTVPYTSAPWILEETNNCS